VFFYVYAVVDLLPLCGSSYVVVDLLPLWQFEELAACHFVPEVSKARNCWCPTSRQCLRYVGGWEVATAQSGAL